MSKQPPGPREKALREMREANYARAATLVELAPIPKKIKRDLKKAIAEAAKKTGKSRKKKAK